jgi:hypothetical protein
MEDGVKRGNLVWKEIPKKKQLAGASGSSLAHILSSRLAESNSSSLYPDNGDGLLGFSLFFTFPGLRRRPAVWTRARTGSWKKRSVVHG